MIKGVNKQFIEVNDTGSRYFERALLVIRPEFNSVPYEKLKGEAKKAIGRMGEPESARRVQARNLSRMAMLRRRRFLRLIASALICASGIILGVALSSLF